ncbi:MAG: hypothetical protein EZS28_014571 [Streblomastix strix]|uniref:Cell cycle checkpoint protein RAD17 n=1 Tax=Streblomastix strix TaxID=222440 RepID=A0A5J4W620_9EUKA|nr:MAG: hypothetical protein EZS28_014571 [Streblomastix strix]
MQVSDLVVHKKKVEEVSRWLLERLQSFQNARPISQQRILIILGSSGTGKTETLRSLCKSQRVEIVEWEEVISQWNPGQQDEFGVEYISQRDRFREFVFQSQRYSPLQFDGNQDQVQKQTNQSTSNPRIVLIDGIPLLVNHSASDDFISSILAFAHAFQMDSTQLSPFALQNPTSIGIVLILTTSNASSPSATQSNINQSGPSYLHALSGFTEQDYVVRQLMGRGGNMIKLIKFNPIATTFLTKALIKHWNNKQEKKSQQSQSLLKTSDSKQQYKLKNKNEIPLDDIISASIASSFGDIRSAIQSFDLNILYAQ